MYWFLFDFCCCRCCMHKICFSPHVLSTWWLYQHVCNWTYKFWPVDMLNQRCDTLCQSFTASMQRSVLWCGSQYVWEKIRSVNANPKNWAQSSIINRLRHSLNLAVQDTCRSIITFDTPLSCPTFSNIVPKRNPCSKNLNQNFLQKLQVSNLFA